MRQPTLKAPFCVALFGDDALRAICTDVWRHWAESRGLAFRVTKDRVIVGRM